MHSKALLLVAASFVFGCSHYSRALESGRKHYEANRYENALAVLRDLEVDMLTLSSEEQARYAYYRGMSDYRIASLSPKVPGLADPHMVYRANARHWLGLATALEKATPRALTSDQKQHLQEALADVNEDVFRGESHASTEELDAEPSSDLIKAE